MSIYSSVTIKGQRPIEGSVSISLDEGSNEITKLRYEGGGIADLRVLVDNKPTLTLEWKTAGKVDSASTKASEEITIATDQDTTGIKLTGIYIVSPSWDSQWGFVTQHKLIQKPSIT